MAAGLGFKTFTTGEVLTAGDVNGYLMQGINVFATTTARNAAITAPAEGQFAFTKDTNSLWYYDGAAWVASGATGDIEGVTAGVGISGGGTSGTVTVTNSMATAIDAKGDLVPGTGADTFARLAVGANNTVLTADSAEATGMKWAAVAGGSMTLLATGTLTGSAVALTSIDQTYKALRLVLQSTSLSASDQGVLRFNNDSSNSYTQVGLYGGGVSGTYVGAAGTICKLNNLNTNAGSTNNSSVIDFPNYAQTGTVKLINLTSGYYGPDSATHIIFTSATNYHSNSAISSIYIRADYGGAYTWDNGTYYLYGVN